MSNSIVTEEQILNDSKMSPHVRPILAVIAGIVLIFAIPTMVIIKLIPPEWLWVIASFPLWYFGFREFSKFVTLISNAKGVVPASAPIIIQKTDGSVQVIQPSNGTPITNYIPPTIFNPANPPQEAPVIIPIPFNKTDFLAKVEAGILSDYGIVNASTKFFEAKRVLNNFWNFNNDQAWEDAKAVVAELSEEAFKEIWGVDFDTAEKYINDPKKGCKTCTVTAAQCTYPNLKFKAIQLGMGYYAAYLDVVDWRERINE